MNQALVKQQSTMHAGNNYTFKQSEENFTKGGIEETKEEKAWYANVLKLSTLHRTYSSIIHDVELVIFTISISLPFVV